MANTLAVCLLATILCCTGLSHARQVPAHCAKGPELWCKSLRKAAECGAVQHCIGTIWEHQVTQVTVNDVSTKILSFFKEMKDVKDLINNDYLATRVSSACRLLPDPRVAAICQANTVGLAEHVAHLLASKATPQTICRIIEVCVDNEVIEFSKPASLVVDNKAAQSNNKKHSMPELVGAEKCTWGPSYWCNNFSTGRECKAMHHCLTRVWPNTKFPVDNDDICKICKDMVTQARDQLMSNETQTELKEVFEGSCQLIPIKIVAKECMKIADEFVPELVETLSSQMDPNAVCSVAGLCNSERIDKLLEDYNSHIQHFKECSGCKSTVSLIRNKFKDSTYDDFLVSLLQICRKMSSLSDSCSMLVFKYYENIREAIEQDLKPQALCHLSGQCSHSYTHTHIDYIFPAEIEDPKTMKADVPCEFCEQLVTHLRDMLIANTTEEEFYKVLTGLCKQSGKFKSECLSLAEQYYAIIYKYLTADLEGDKICTIIGVCNKTDSIKLEPVEPIMASELVAHLKKTLSTTPFTPSAEAIIPLQSASITEHIPMHMSQRNGMSPAIPPLPIERMFVAMPKTKTSCTFCQYFLHYMQVELSDVKNENYIRDSVMGACEKLPKVVNAECKQFVSEYGPAVIALLVQEIDPSTVCPALRLCTTTIRPSAAAVTTPAPTGGQSNCPLCLFAVEQLETVLKNNKTEASIHKAMDGLCNHLSLKLKAPCLQFVDQYYSALVEMLLADLNAQEICVYLKLCKDHIIKSGPIDISTRMTVATTKRTPEYYMSIDKFMDNPGSQADFGNTRQSNSRPTMSTSKLMSRLETQGATGGDIETNEIPDNTANGQPIKPTTQKTVCIVCEFVMKEIDDQIKDKHNEDEIKRVVRSVCKRMPKSVRSDCDQFVEKYADLVISLLAQELDPSEVCEELKLCPSLHKNINAAKAEEILDCAVCETVVTSVKKVLKNDVVDRNIVHVIEKSCALLPAKYSDRCRTMMDIYGDSVIHLVEEYGSKQVCQKIGLCSAYNAAFVDLYYQKIQRESPSPRA